MKPKLLISLPVGSNLHGDNPRGIVDLARRVEDAGADGVVLADHVLLGKHVDKYPWGTFPFTSDVPWLEPLTMLTAIAAVTERIKLATGILIVPLRPAALLAKMIATLDRFSGGRVELGVGTGWQAEELTAQGIDPSTRGRVMTDYVAACRALWTDSPATFHSESVTFEDVWSEPKPVRAGGPPVLFSGTLTKRNLDRIVRLGDGWIPIMGESHEGIASGIEQVRGEYAKAGRAPEELVIRTGLPMLRDGNGKLSLEATLAGAGPLAEVGVTDVHLTLTAFAPDDEGARRLFDRAPDPLGERDVTVEIQLDGQVAVVTGGGDGIGGAISDVLAAAGAHVVVVDIDAEHAAARVDGITSGGGRAQAVVADVRDREQVAQIARVATDVAGHIDILVNNVGDYRPPGPFLSGDEDQWTAQYEINLLHVLRYSRAIVPGMVAQGSGSVINVSSVEGIRGYPHDPVYGAFKAAVNHFTRCLALDVASSGVRVNAIAPDVTQTSQVDYEQMVPPELRDHWPIWVPIGRVGAPADNADVVLFLASDLSRFITGHVIPTDGGTLAAGGWFRTFERGRWTNRPRNP